MVGDTEKGETREKREKKEEKKIKGNFLFILRNSWGQGGRGHTLPFGLEIQIKREEKGKTKKGETWKRRKGKQIGRTFGGQGGRGAYYALLVWDT